MKPEEYWTRMRWYAAMLGTSMFISFTIYMAFAAVLQLPFDNNEMMLYYVGGVLTSPVVAFALLRAFDYLNTKRKRILNKTRRSAQSCRVPRFQKGQEDITAKPGVKWTGHRMCIGGVKHREGRTSRSTLNQLNKLTEAEERKDRRARKYELEAEIEDVKQQIAEAGVGQGKNKLRKELQELEAEYRQVLFMGDEDDQRKAMGDLTGEWTEEKSKRVKEKMEVRSGGSSAAVRDMKKVVDARVAEEIAIMEEEYTGPIITDVTDEE